jgi:hypothetical protein
MATANTADFLGEGTKGGQQQGRPRATTPDGLFYVDTGEPTPLYVHRQQAIQGLIGSNSFTDTNYKPSGANADAYKYDAKKGQYYFTDSKGRKTYINNDPANNYDVGQAPIFTANQAPKVSKDYSQSAQMAAYGALGGAKLGPAGAALGAGAGAIAGLPSANGRGLFLTAGDPAQVDPNQRVGTAAEAALGNATYQATGRSTPAGGFAPPIVNQSSMGGAMPSNYATNQGSNNAISSQAQQVLANANALAAQNQTRANASYAQGSAAGSRAAPQMALPSSADQQAVYQRAMGFNADSGSAAIRAAQADVSGAGRLENMQLDQQGIRNLEGFQNTNSQQGVNALYGYNPSNTAAGLGQVENFRAKETAQGVANLDGYSATNTLNSANKLDNFYSHDAQQGADALQQFHTSDAAATQQQALAGFQSDRSGIDRLNNYASEAQGPSAAQAMLRSQADADKRTALAISRSGRGGAGAIANAQRQAISEGAAIAGETRGQGAALAAQEFEAYKGRQLQALAQAGSLISNAEAQRLSAMQASGQMLTEQDSQKLAAVQAFAQVKTAMDAQRLSAQQSAGQLNASADTNRLGALQTSGQLRSNMDAQRLSGLQSGLQARSAMDSQILSATTSAAGLQGDMDQRTLGAISNAAQLRTQGDQIRSNNLQAAGNIRLQGSEINQRGAIAASDADLRAQALNLQSLSLAGQVSSDIRNQDINVLRSNLDASLQTLGLNDNQVRFFNQLGSDREVASQNLQMQAGALGVNAQQAQEALNLQWQQFGLSQLSQQQQNQYQQALLAQNGSQFAQQQALAQQQQNFGQQQVNRQNTFNTLGAIFQGAGMLFQPSPTSSASAAAQAAQVGLSNSGYNPAPYSGYGVLPQQQNLAGQDTSRNVGFNSQGQVYDPFTGTWKNKA